MLMKVLAMPARLSDLIPQLHDAAVQYQCASEADKSRALASYVRVLTACLGEGGLDDVKRAPLINVWDAAAEIGSHPRRERRSNTGIASPALLARVCAVLDLIVADGVPEKTAAEILVQQLVLSGVRLPDFQGSLDSVMGLLDWRMRLFTTKEPSVAWFEYDTFTSTFAGLRAPRIKNALNQRLWDRRTKRRKSL